MVDIQGEIVPQTVRIQRQPEDERYQGEKAGEKD